MCYRRLSVACAFFNVYSEWSGSSEKRLFCFLYSCICYYICSSPTPYIHSNFLSPECLGHYTSKEIINKQNGKNWRDNFYQNIHTFYGLLLRCDIIGKMFTLNMYICLLRRICIGKINWSSNSFHIVSYVGSIQIKISFIMSRRDKDKHSMLRRNLMHMMRAAQPFIHWSLRRRETVTFVVSSATERARARIYI